MAKRIVVFLGPTGAGKSEQGARIASKVGGIHISTGAMLREATNQEVIADITAGKLAPSEVVQDLLMERLESAPANAMILLDGFPRMLDEAEWLARLETKADYFLVQVIWLEISEEEAKKRLLARGREDDSEESIRHKWDDYHRQTEPVKEYYLKAGKISIIDGIGDRETITERIMEALKSYEK